MLKYKTFLLTIFLTCLSCTSAEGPPGQILIKNDILDKSYNSFIVDQVRSPNGIVSFRKTLRPGEKVVIPEKNITSLRFSRRYEGHTKVYVVNCPENVSEAISMKLIDVHTNRLDGGCKLVKRGKMVRGVVDWE